MEMDAIKKIQTEGVLEMENLGRGIGTTDMSITNRIQEMEKRILGIKDTYVRNHLEKTKACKRIFWRCPVFCMACDG